MSKIDADEIIQFGAPKDFEKWLSRNFDKKPGVWLKFAKKGTGVKTVVYPEALDVALCYGWIDGISRRLDETFYLQRFSPRGKRSVWSKINREHIARLIKEGRMKPSGQAEVDLAKADGRWEAAYDGPATITMHPDFKKALEKNKKALAFFESLNKTSKYPFLIRTQMAKKPETRAGRIEQFILMLEEGKKLR